MSYRVQVQVDIEWDQRVTISAATLAEALVVAILARETEGDDAPDVVPALWNTLEYLCTREDFERFTKQIDTQLTERRGPWTLV